MALSYAVMIYYDSQFAFKRMFIRIVRPIFFFFFASFLMNPNYSSFLLAVAKTHLTLIVSMTRKFEVVHAMRIFNV